MSFLLPLCRTPQMIPRVLNGMVTKHFRAPREYRRGDGRSRLPIQLVGIKITNACNLRCKTCAQWGETGYNFNRSAKDLARVVPVEAYLDLVRQLAPHRPFYYIWGGEPFLYPDILKLTAAIKENRSLLALVTNATFLEANAEAVVDQGWDALMFSLDGPEALHDEIRGRKGTFKKVKAGIDAVKKRKTETGRSVPWLMPLITVSTWNAASLDDIVQVASELGADAPLLAAMSSTDDRLHHVVAGKATRCCQKNHNLLTGIEVARRMNLTGDIYVFADMDICPGHDWLSQITLPLSDPDVFAVSGFRSLIPRSDRFCEHLHATFSAFQAMAMTETAYAAMWGGSMALRRNDFERYGVDDKWSTAIVDDMSLTWIIRKHRLKRVFSPDCLVTSRETYPELGRVMKWLVRQTQYAAIYLRAYTAFGLCLNSALTLSMLMCPILMVLAFLGIISNGVAVLSVLMYLLTATGISLLGIFVRQKGITFRWFFYAPCFLVIGTFCGWIGYFSRRLSWADIFYRFNRSGEVLTVEQLALAER
jgi:molybdenum cofactor biosynthesis enzyme MoaA